MSTTGSTATELYCPKCPKRYSLDTIINLCTCGSPLLVDYDYGKAARVIGPEVLSRRTGSMWKYVELLPVQHESHIVTLSEGDTPLLRSKTIGPSLNLPNLYFKDESVNPTGSFKARGMSAAVSRAKELGIENLIAPTAGNAGSALAAYAARAGLKSHVIMPRETPKPFMVDCVYHGATIELVEGSIKDCGELAAKKVNSEGWFSMATLKEPYRIEGKKTMGYEIAEQLKWKLPDVIIYPTGGGTGLIGMWKAFAEMEKLGWLKGNKPRMVSVQSEGCAPIVRAFEQGKNEADLWEDPQTVAAGLRVPGAIGDFLILQAIRESGGLAVAVSEKELLDDTRELAAREGIFSAPEGGAVLAAVKKLLASGFIRQTDTVIAFITGSGYKYLDTLGAALTGPGG